MHPLLTVHAPTLSRRLLFLPRGHIKDTEGLLLSVLEASLNLVEFLHGANGAEQIPGDPEHPTEDRGDDDDSGS